LISFISSTGFLAYPQRLLHMFLYLFNPSRTNFCGRDTLNWPDLAL